MMPTLTLVQFGFEMFQPHRHGRTPTRDFLTIEATVARARPELNIRG